MNTGIKKEWKNYNLLYKGCFGASIMCSGLFFFYIFIFKKNEVENIMCNVCRNGNTDIFDFAVFFFAACTVLLTIVAVFSSKLSAKLTVFPILRLTVKTTCDKIILHAENVGNGPLFFEGSKGNGCRFYIDLINEIKEICHKNEVTISELYMGGCTNKILAKNEKIALLSIKGDKRLFMNILIRMDNYKFLIKFTDMFGNEYEEEIKPEIYKYKETPCPQA